MQARTHRRIDAFDRSVGMLRDYVKLLEAQAALKRSTEKDMP